MLVPAVVRVAALAALPLLELPDSASAAGLPAPVSAVFLLLFFFFQLYCSPEKMYVHVHVMYRTFAINLIMYYTYAK